MEKIRLFICMNLPDQIHKQVNDLVHDLKLRGRGVRWVRPEGMHLTLKFLGDTYPDQVDEIASALEQILAGFKPMTIKVKGLGAFPSYRRPRVLWAGLEEASGELVRLAKAIEVAVVRLGFPREDRPYSPHLTLGRIKMQNTLIHIINHMQSLNFEAGEFMPDKVVIMRSDLSRESAVYTPLKLLPLQ